MLIACDCHVHIYPNYNLSTLLESAWDNLHRIAPDSTIKALCLTERFDCHFFKNAAQSFSVFPMLHYTLGTDYILVNLGNNKELYIVPGRQIITAERLELLALTKDVTTPDGLSFQDAYSDIKQQGALAVINWAPGKWFFKRGALIAKIIEDTTADNLLFCDTTLRCSGWQEPILMRKAIAKGFKVIAGSDPLPIPNEEQIAGEYAIAADIDFNLKNPSESLRSMLANSNRRFVGKRNNIFTMLRRVITHMNSHKSSS